MPSLDESSSDSEYYTPPSSPVYDYERETALLSEQILEFDNRLHELDETIESLQKEKERLLDHLREKKKKEDPRVTEEKAPIHPILRQVVKNNLEKALKSNKLKRKEDGNKNTHRVVETVTTTYIEDRQKNKERKAMEDELKRTLEEKKKEKLEETATIEHPQKKDPVIMKEVASTPKKDSLPMEGVSLTCGKEEKNENMLKITTVQTHQEAVKSVETVHSLKGKEKSEVITDDNSTFTSSSTTHTQGGSISNEVGIDLDQPNFILMNNATIKQEWDGVPSQYNERLTDEYNKEVVANNVPVLPFVRRNFLVPASSKNTAALKPSGPVSRKKSKAAKRIAKKAIKDAMEKSISSSGGPFIQGTTINNSQMDRSQLVKSEHLYSTAYSTPRTKVPPLHEPTISMQQIAPPSTMELLVNKSIELGSSQATSSSLFTPLMNSQSAPVINPNTLFNPPSVPSKKSRRRGNKNAKQANLSNISGNAQTVPANKSSLPMNKNISQTSLLNVSASTSTVPVNPSIAHMNNSSLSMKNSGQTSLPNVSANTSTVPVNPPIAHLNNSNRSMKNSEQTSLPNVSASTSTVPVNPPIAHLNNSSRSMKNSEQTSLPNVSASTSTVPVNPSIAHLNNSSRSMKKNTAQNSSPNVSEITSVPPLVKSFVPVNPPSLPLKKSIQTVLRSADPPAAVQPGSKKRIFIDLTEDDDDVAPEGEYAELCKMREMINADMEKMRNELRHLNNVVSQKRPRLDQDMTVIRCEESPTLSRDSSAISSPKKEDSIKPSTFSVQSPKKEDSIEPSTFSVQSPKKEDSIKPSTFNVQSPKKDEGMPLSPSYDDIELYGESIPQKNDQSSVSCG
ncbi:hypothetical protein BDB01DRAFT_807026 [Pilobolus umbonatus]|nr:hypothetical protein BDB01DRAFT_807026 [Pilobolus umbonatus]